MKLFQKQNKIETNNINNAPIQKEERSYLTGVLNFNSIGSYTSSKSMSLSAVYSAVNQISNGIACLPLYVYNTDVQGFKNIDFQHPAFSILNKQPTRNLSRFQFFKLIISSVQLKGNAYVLIIRDNKGKVKNLRYLPVEWVTVNYNTNTDTVLYQVVGIDNPVTAENMLHFWIYSNNTVTGISIISHADESLELCYDSESHAKNFFKSGGALSGILKAKSRMDKDQKQDAKDSWNSAFSTTAANGVAVLGGDFDFQPVSVSARDGQILESRQFNVLDIARWFSISPVRLGVLDNASYSTLEQVQLEFLETTLKPYIEMIEGELNRKLWLPSEANFSAGFDYTSMLNTDKKSLAEYYKILVTNGLATVNECRKALNMNDVVGGDDLLIQLNMSTLKNISDGKNLKQESQPNKIKK